MSTLRLGRVARDRDAALEPHNGAAVGRQDLELLVLEVFRDGLKARGHVSRDRLAQPGVAARVLAASGEIGA